MTTAKKRILIFIISCVACIVLVLSMLAYELTTYKQVKNINVLIEEGDHEQLEITVKKNRVSLNHIPYPVVLFTMIVEAVPNYTPLQTACIENDPISLKILLENGADPNYIPVSPDAPPLSLAASRGNIEMVSALLNAGADAKEQGFSTVVSFFKYANNAAKNGIDVPLSEFTALIEMLEQNGFDLQKKDKTDRTVLAYASLYGNLNFVRYLIEERGMVVDDIDTEGETLLHLSIRTGWVTPDVSFVEYLLECGVPTDAVDDAGKTAYDYAVEKGYTDIVELLQSRNN